MDYTIGRDIRSEDINKIAETLQEWCESCESVLATIEEQIDRANTYKASRVKHQDDIETEVTLADNEIRILTVTKCVLFEIQKKSEISK